MKFVKSEKFSVSKKYIGKLNSVFQVINVSDSMAKKAQTQNDKYIFHYFASSLKIQNFKIHF